MSTEPASQVEPALVSFVPASDFASPEASADSAIGAEGSDLMGPGVSPGSSSSVGYRAEPDLSHHFHRKIRLCAHCLDAGRLKLQCASTAGFSSPCRGAAPEHQLEIVPFDWLGGKPPRCPGVVAGEAAAPEKCAAANFSLSEAQATWRPRGHYFQ